MFALAACIKENPKSSIRRVKTLSRFIVSDEPIKGKKAEINQEGGGDSQHVHLQVPFIATIQQSLGTV